MNVILCVWIYWISEPFIGVLLLVYLFIFTLAFGLGIICSYFQIWFEFPPPPPPFISMWITPAWPLLQSLSIRPKSQAKILINFTQPSSIFSTWHYSGSVPQHYQVSSSTPYLLHHTHPHPSYPPLITCPRCLLYHSYSHSSHPLNSYTHLNGLPISQCLGKWSLSFVAHVFS